MAESFLLREDGNIRPIQPSIGLMYLGTAQGSIALTINQLTTVNIPDTASVLRLYPSGNVLVGYNATAATAASSGSATIQTTNFGYGGTAIASQWTVAMLPAATGRYITLRAVTGSPTCQVEVS